MSETKRFAEGFSSDKDWRKAVLEASRAARAKLGPVPCDLALVFASEGWPDFKAEELPELLAKSLSPLFTLGCNAYGVIAGRREVEGDPGVSVLAMRLPGVKVHPFALAPTELAKLETGADLVGALDLYPTDGPRFLAFADPMSCEVEKFLGLMNQGYPGLPVAGGLSSGPVLRRPTWILHGREVLRSGVAGVALTGAIEFETIVAQGCRPIGEPLIVTKADGNTLLELGGKPPLEVLRETLSRCSPDDQRLARHSLFAGLVIDERRRVFGRGDFLIRNLVGFDQDTGAVVVGAALRRGQTMQFQLRDARTSDQDLQTLLGALPEADATPRGALLVTCCGRGKGLYGEPDHDATLVQSMRGPVPMVGLFANGEFGPVSGRNFIHGYTSSLLLIR